MNSMTTSFKIHEFMNFSSRKLSSIVSGLYLKLVLHKVCLHNRFSCYNFITVYTKREHFKETGFTWTWAKIDECLTEDMEWPWEWEACVTGRPSVLWSLMSFDQLLFIILSRCLIHMCSFHGIFTWQNRDYCRSISFLFGEEKGYFWSIIIYIHVTLWLIWLNCCLEKTLQASQLRWSTLVVFWKWHCLCAILHVNENGCAEIKKKKSTIRKLCDQLHKVIFPIFYDPVLLRFPFFFFYSAMRSSMIIFKTHWYWATSREDSVTDYGRHSRAASVWDLIPGEQEYVTPEFWGLTAVTSLLSLVSPQPSCSSLPPVSFKTFLTFNSRY